MPLYISNKIPNYTDYAGLPDAELISSRVNTDNRIVCPVAFRALRTLGPQYKPRDRSLTRLALFVALHTSIQVTTFFL
jgi:hypothetical protein